MIELDKPQADQVTEICIKSSQHDWGGILVYRHPTSGNSRNKYE